MQGEVPELAEREDAGAAPDLIVADGESGGAAEPPAQHRAPRSRRRAPARVGALIALAAVGGAIALITTSTLNPVTPALVPVTPTVLKLSFHHVLAGESLAIIAARYHSTVALLEQLNPNVNPQQLRPGQVLKVGTETSAKSKS